MFFKIKNHIFLITLLFILNNCSLQEPSLNHGIVFLEKRAEKLILNKSNKNDVLSIIGQPHIKSIKNQNDWIYIERTLTKGDYHKLGQTVLKTNNVLVLSFNKYGILENKIFLDKNAKKKLNFSEKETANELTQKSFVDKFLSSLKQKMYGNK
tara:strand:+ start:99 stop:557 length:459 start_codon:yes stop_codon:yes gene_type:complete